MNTFAPIMVKPVGFKLLKYSHSSFPVIKPRLNISSRYFYDVCIRETGMTSKQFIDDVIISEMKHRILGSSMTFQQISFIFGFEDQTAFTQYFKRITGLTPTEFRNRFR